jgi:hypothetical protein
MDEGDYTGFTQGRHAFFAGAAHGGAAGRVDSGDIDFELFHAPLADKGANDALKWHNFCMYGKRAGRGTGFGGIDAFSDNPPSLCNYCSVTEVLKLASPSRSNRYVFDTPAHKLLILQIGVGVNSFPFTSAYLHSIGWDWYTLAFS